MGPDGQRLVQNKRLNELWKIPEEVAAAPNTSVQFEFASSRVTNPAEFAAKVAWLEARRDAVSFDNIELLDGTLLNRYTAPLWDAEGHYYGRIWAFRDMTGEKKVTATPQKEE